MVSSAVFATNYTGTNNGSTNTQSKTSSNASDDESELLSSEDWNALLNTSSEESSQTTSEAISNATVLNSPLANGIGGDSVFIWGCIAVGLGVLGIAFFIYSQFIYKHMKKPETNQTHSNEGIMDQSKESLPMHDESYKALSLKEQPKHENTKATESKPKSDSKTDEIDWDKFFEDHKNQNYKDE